ncbi:hypothetical protein SLE2022_173560 [Rubroshorea leprosula]
MEDVLDGSLRLLDICSTARDVFSQIKGCVLDIESSLRRKNGTESSITNEIEKYFILTEQLNRIPKKFFGNTKRMQQNDLGDRIPKKFFGNTRRMQQNDLGDMSGMLREVEAISLTIFESMYSLICPRNSKTKGWSLVSKMIQPNRVCFVDKIDDVLNDLIIYKSQAKAWVSFKCKRHYRVWRHWNQPCKKL